MPKALFNWSGGKDSALALYHLLQEDAYTDVQLLTTAGEKSGRVSMHGVRTELVERQARALGLPLHLLRLPEPAPMPVYERIMAETLTAFRDRQYQCSVFGDIFLEDLRAFREKNLAQADMQGVFPLWGRDSRQLVSAFIELGFKAVVVCVNAKHLDASFAGRPLDYAFLRDLPPGVDPCGENGEYHSFVYDGPLFREPVRFTQGEKVFRRYAPAPEDDDNCFATPPAPFDTGFWYLDLLPL
ncbi:MAG: COG2102: Predicted ATPases of PP-loop superfamily [uncultured Cytophagales bacterium]|uniref:COG2102: Predicted ATPases of PP-loop superfamily n=1 Tax=uncultured Cytophagales bacterium TaxID=158755 RepID=A0A6J4JSP0_9SPHI|nr:MAG: COG2102: Predicted ATPases of PP-loop superfamily [uncultured Cytophagales bacterium]